MARLQLQEERPPGGASGAGAPSGTAVGGVGGPGGSADTCRQTAVSPACVTAGGAGGAGVPGGSAEGGAGGSANGAPWNWW
jgi:hypothetical protein